MLNFHREGLYKNQNRKVKVFLLLSIRLNGEAFWFHMHLHLDRPNPIHTEQLWDFSGYKFCTMYPDLVLQRRKGRDRLSSAIFKSLIFTTAFPGC